MEKEETGTIEKVMLFWIISIIISFFVGALVGTLHIKPNMEENTYNKDLVIINNKLDLLKGDTNNILYEYDALTVCRLNNQEYKDKLLYVYGDDLKLNN